MTSRQKGFSVLHVLLIFVIIGIISGTGRYVYKAQKSANAAISQSNGSDVPKFSRPEQPGKATEEKYEVPAGYTLYENKALGFKFAYPSEWKTLQEKQALALRLYAETPNNEMVAPDFLDGMLKVQVAPPKDFVVEAQYHVYSLTPDVSEKQTVWRIKESGLLPDKYIPGEQLWPSPEIIVEKDGLQVYHFPSGHACAVWSKLAFKSGDNFVGIELPSVCPMQAETEEIAQAAFKKYRTTTVQVAKSIRLMP